MGTVFFMGEVLTEQDNKSALFDLGYIYYSGNGVEKDYKKAIELYSKAASLGHMQAYNNLGFCYENGFGVPVDLKKAIEFYRISANMGNSTAKENLQRLGY